LVAGVQDQLQPLIKVIRAVFHLLLERQYLKILLALEQTPLNHMVGVVVEVSHLLLAIMAVLVVEEEWRMR
jgi:hypothetical protein